MRVQSGTPQRDAPRNTPAFQAVSSRRKRAPYQRLPATSRATRDLRQRPLGPGSGGCGGPCLHLLMGGGGRGPPGKDGVIPPEVYHMPEVIGRKFNMD